MEEDTSRCLLDISECVAIVFVLISSGATLDITANGLVIGHKYRQKTRSLNTMLIKMATAMTPVIHMAVIKGSRKTLIPNSLNPQRGPTNANRGRPQLLNFLGNLCPRLNRLTAPAIAPTGHTAHHDLPKKNKPAKIIGYQKIPDNAKVIKLASEDSGPVKPSYMNATSNITKNICKNNG
jgi:hypothetical protein